MHVMGGTAIRSPSPHSKALLLSAPQAREKAVRRTAAYARCTPAPTRPQAPPSNQTQSSLTRGSLASMNPRCSLIAPAT